MKTNLEKLIDALLELKTSSIKSTEYTIKSTMHKYGMLFLGYEFNKIYSVELQHCLKNVFNFIIDKDELNSLIPTACNMLNMKFEQMTTIETIGKPNPDISYQIILF